jgi:putative DNA primase/helicase
MPTGSASGRIVIDVDPRHGGDKALQELQEKYGMLPPTLEVKTGSGGLHLHFQRNGAKVRNSAGKLGKGLDVRGDGGYVILPPSAHQSGNRYQWVDESQPLLDMPRWLERLLVEKQPRLSRVNGEGRGAKIPLGQRNDFLASVAGRFRREGVSEEIILEVLLGRNEKDRDPPLPEAEVRRIAKSIVRYEPEDGQVRVGSTREDTSNAERFARQHKDSVRFWHGRNKWLLWTGNHWAEDQYGGTAELAKKTARSIYHEAAALPDKEAAQMGRWAERSLNREKVNALMDLAKTDERIRITTDRLDCDPWLLNFMNGTVDLRTGNLRPHRREDYITKLVRCDYIPNLIGPRWSLFLQQTFGEELANVVQKAIGYAISGITSEKVMFLLWGPTDSGKTTFLASLREVFIDYSSLIQIETLMWSKNQDNNSSADLADLRGARLAITSETEEDQRLREAKLKRITQGMGDIKTTRKYENPITFPETHKLWMDCNHQPVVRGCDDAIWNRLIPIPCTHKLADAERDPDLNAKLIREREAIVSWAVAGAMRWHKEGLGRPEIVEQARSEWRERMDVMGEFLSECCVEQEAASAESFELYRAYKEWSEKQGHAHPMTATAFGLRLGERGFKGDKAPKTRRKVYKGLRLMTPPEQCEGV